MKPAAIQAIAISTFKEAIRARWLLMFSLVFFFLAINLPLLLLVSVRYLPEDYLGLYLPYLVSLSFPFIPLLGLPIGSGGVVDDRESGVLQYLMSNPISKADFLTGRMLGLLVATSLVIFIGYGSAGILAYGANVPNYHLILIVALAAILINSIMIALSMVYSMLSKRKSTALGAAIFTWFLLSVVSNLGFLSTILSLSNNLFLVLPMILVNPVETGRILATLQISTGTVTGDATTRIVQIQLGNSGSNVLVVSLLFWLFIMSVLSLVIFKRQDVI